MIREIIKLNDDIFNRGYFEDSLVQLSRNDEHSIKEFNDDDEELIGYWEYAKAHLDNCRRFKLYVLTPELYSKADENIARKNTSKTNDTFLKIKPIVANTKSND